MGSPCEGESFSWKKKSTFCWCSCDAGICSHLIRTKQCFDWMLLPGCLPKDIRKHKAWEKKSFISGYCQQILVSAARCLMSVQEGILLGDLQRSEHLCLSSGSPGVFQGHMERKVPKYSKRSTVQITMTHCKVLYDIKGRDLAVLRKAWVSLGENHSFGVTQKVCIFLKGRSGQQQLDYSTGQEK